MTKRRPRSSAEPPSPQRHQQKRRKNGNGTWTSRNSGNASSSSPLLPRSLSAPRPPSSLPKRPESPLPRQVPKSVMNRQWNADTARRIASQPFTGQQGAPLTGLQVIFREPKLYAEPTINSLSRSVASPAGPSKDISPASQEPTRSTESSANLPTHNASSGVITELEKKAENPLRPDRTPQEVTDVKNGARGSWAGLRKPTTGADERSDGFDNAEDTEEGARNSAASSEALVVGGRKTIDGSDAGDEKEEGEISDDDSQNQAQQRSENQDIPMQDEKNCGNEIQGASTEPEMPDELVRSMIPVDCKFHGLKKLLTGLERSSFFHFRKYLPQEKLPYSSAGRVTVDGETWRDLFWVNRQTLPLCLPNLEYLIEGSPKWEATFTRDLNMAVQAVINLRNNCGHKEPLEGSGKTTDIWKLVSDCIPFAVMVGDAELEEKLKKFKYFITGLTRVVREQLKKVDANTDLSEDDRVESECQVLEQAGSDLVEEVDKIFYSEGRPLITVDRIRKR